MNWEDKSNNQIKTELLTMKEEYEAIQHNVKLFLLKLKKIDSDFDKGNEVLRKRINGISNE